MAGQVYSGVFPIAPTTFDERGELDLESQKRALDFMIDGGVDGICILANFSEQFSLTDDERERLTGLILDHVAGRVPVIVTTSHFGSRVAAERSRRAQAAGAAMVMLMPPYHGATIRADEVGIVGFFRAVAEAISIPIMIQDAPVSGTVLPAPFLARLAREIDRISYFKIEVPGAATKLRALIEQAGDAIDGPFDGEESITLIPDLDAGATGTMPSALIADVLGTVVRLHRGGDRDAAVALWERHLPLINYENRQCGLRAAKALMKEGGIIRSEACRHPLPPLPPPIRSGLVELARRLGVNILRWA
ncbi:MAG TPA: dihydrodipicolinate synthase family protein [Chloroflexota bacterium]|jgi:dihydrodipicolinate synthase/N-acetylneuraminate lyase|nr:dihydrodipicolinate synthase family protein [Chloroflexota bacterium]